MRRPLVSRFRGPAAAWLSALGLALLIGACATVGTISRWSA